MIKLKTIACVAGASLVLAACVAGSPEAHHAASGGALQIFLLGIWHGLIAPFMIIGEIINLVAPRLLPWTLRMYETDASSVAYDLGFYIGLAIGPSAIFGGFRR